MKFNYYLNAIVLTIGLSAICRNLNPRVYCGSVGAATIATAKQSKITLPDAVWLVFDVMSTKQYDLFFLSFFFCLYTIAFLKVFASIALLLDVRARSKKNNKQH